MSVVDRAKETQLQNIQKKTGKTLDELCATVRASGLAKHGEICAMLKADLALGHGDANAIALYARNVDSSAAAPASREDMLDAIYAGPKAALRPIHDRLMVEIHGLGEFEIAPKKDYLSLRRKKQFAMVGPATNTRVEVGLNTKGVEATDRLIAMPPGGMCLYKIKLTDPAEVDAELIAWIKQAFEAAG
jgi:hypothetical protein